MAGLNRLSDTTFAETISTEKGIAVVDFWAAWCPPCRVLSGILAGIAEELADTHRFYEIDTDLNPVTSTAYGVRSLPTVILFSEGREIGRIVGALPREAFRRRMDAIVEGTAGVTAR